MKNELTINNLGQNFEASKEFWWSIKIKDLFHEKVRQKSYGQFLNSIHVNVTRVDFEKLKNIASNAKLKYSKKDIDGKKSMSLDQFMAQKAKGSKKYRKILTKKGENSIPHNILKFAECTNTIINLDNSLYLNDLWNRGYFSNCTRSFIFKLHNNTLGYNTRVSHFVRGHPDTCTFCDLRLVPEENRETPYHLLYDCDTVELVLNPTMQQFTGDNL